METSEVRAERRRFTRRYEESVIQFKGADFEIYSRSPNWSPGGIFVRTHYLLEPGSQVEVQIPLGGAAGSVPLSGRVVRAADPTHTGNEEQVGLGIEFGEMSEEARQSLLRASGS